MSVKPSPLSTRLFWLKRPGRWLRSLIGWALALLLLAWGLVMVAWGCLHWVILPHIDEWRPALERHASQALGATVRIGSIEVTSGGWIPAIEMREVRLLDPSGREALRLPKVAAALSARSLLSLNLRFEQLLIDAPQVEVRRDAKGRFFVAGLSVDEAAQAESTGLAEEWADWLLSQHEFVILNGRVRWIDERRATQALELSDLNLVLRNGVRRHELRLDATPPPQWGQRFGLRGRFTQTLLGRPSDFQGWSGQLYADLPRADLRELRRHIDLPFELSEGDGALRAWVDFKQGQPQGVTSDLALRAVKLRLTPKADQLDLEKIEGRLQFVHAAQSLSLQASQLGFISGDGVIWPRTDWKLALRLPKPAAGSVVQGLPIGGELSAERLDLALMSQLAQRLPFDEQTHAWLAEMAPQGVLSRLSASWEGPVMDPRRYQVKGRLEGLRLGGRRQGLEHLGLSGLTLQLDASEKGGQAQLSMADGILELPGVFRQDLPPIQRLSAKLDWRIESAPKQPPHYELRVSRLELLNQDMQGQFDAVWRSGKAGRRLPGWLELTGQIDKIDAVKVHRYLPLAVGDHALDYVRDALRAGEARAVNIRVRGELAKFPFDGERERDGQFRITTQARDIDFLYVPGVEGRASNWPALEAVNAELVFERGGMQIKNGRAKMFAYELSGIKGGIKDLLVKHRLEIEGQGNGPGTELLKFVRQSPVNEASGGLLAAATAGGAAKLKLSLNLPLQDMDKSVVKGAVQLLGGELRLRPDLPLLTSTRGSVEFDRQGVKLQTVQARAFGGDLSVEGGNQADGSLRFTATGVATAEALQRSPELGSVAKLAQAASGQASYRLQVGLNQGLADFSITSNLVGLGLDLPAPLRKEAGASLPLRLQLKPDGSRDAKLDELRFELGNLLQAHYQRDVSVEPARVLRGALSVQDSLAGLPSSGVQLQANLDSVNLDTWNKTLQRLWGSAAAPGNEGGQAASSSGLASAYAPSQIALRANELHFSGRSLTKVVAGITQAPAPTKNTWRFTVDAAQMAGYVELRGAQPAQPARVFARLSRLSLPHQEADGVGQVLDSQPGNVPDLDIVVDDFELRGKRLGRLEIEAQASGPAHDWRLSKLQLKAPDAVLNATGQWLNEPGRALRRTQLDWKLELLDAGDMLERLGQGRVLRGGKGHLTGQLGWAGEPLAPDFASMNGQLHVQLESGQFLNVEPGVGRLMGVLSLQSLPRRFLFDFRDVFSEGFTFDGVTGDVKITRGVASSSNLRTRGVQATVLVDGQADLAAETQNLRVLVVPEFNTGGASLAYIAINPAIGLGTFLAQLVLSKPIAAANTREFRITGSWVDPKVERVEHHSNLFETAPAADAAPAPSAPSAAASAP
ncbi:TIGR02099 family protein [Paucibacter sp. B2R-40]|uniref:YhdP family protein n=1 Tax=Paucibacter sp. B2R-40 TaxID=2893554 RepID=UPI0021E3C88C|nr:YhdP family protein [Paucibacter sp. B2R-40]MCV2353561.1 TIGR02099 family protein [Paucibacter sp. B2R-40]